jgi:hypothetical protein
MLPTTPKRSRISGERTFLSFFPLDNVNNYVKSIDAIVQNERLVIVSTDTFSVQQYYVLYIDGLAGATSFNVVNVLGSDMYETDIIFHGPEEHFDIPIISESQLMTSGQATEISGTDDVVSIQTSPIANRTTNDVDDVTYNVDITLYMDDDVLIGHILGYETLPKEVKIDHTKDYHVLLVLRSYSLGSISTAKHLSTTVYEFVKWESFNPTFTSGKQSYQTWQFTGKASNKYILTEN